MSRIIHVVAWDQDDFEEMKFRYFPSAKLADQLYQSVVCGAALKTGDPSACVFRFDYKPPEGMPIDVDSVNAMLAQHPIEELCRGAQIRYIGPAADPQTWAPSLKPSWN